jgi:hypothetical protein
MNTTLTREIAHRIARRTQKTRAIKAAAQAAGSSQAAARREWERLETVYPRLTQINHQGIKKTLKQGFNARLCRQCREIISNRRLSTPTGWQWNLLRFYEHRDGMTLVGAEYRYEYSRRAGSWWQGASYLVGHDDSGAWAIRVPRTIHTIREALEWSVPQAVRTAEDDGRKIYRQGDVFLVELRSGRDNLTALNPTRHEIRPYRQGRALIHPEHSPVYLPKNTGPVRAYVARSMEAGGGSRRGD